MGTRNGNMKPPSLRAWLGILGIVALLWLGAIVIGVLRWM